MNNESNYIEKINRVEAPEFLFEGIKEKIQLNKAKTKKQALVLSSLTTLLLLINVSFVTVYKNNTEEAEEISVVNPYHFNLNNYLENE